MSSITQAGRDLLAMSTALDRLVFSKAYLLTTYYSDASLSSMTTMPDVSTAPNGAIKNVVFIDGQCRATAEFIGGANQNFSTAIIAARLESQSDAQAIPFCGFNEGDIYSPPSGGLSTYIDIDFYLSFLDASASVQVTEAGAAPVSYVDALRQDIYNGSQGPCRVYKNFIDAQCHAGEGETAFISPTGPDVFYINIPSYPSTGSFTQHKIADFCDHILTIILYDSSYTYVEFYDMRDAAINGQAITLPAPFVRAQLGDESSTKAFVKIAKINNMYFAIAYNNCSSNNQWWYNSTVGQSSNTKATGNCAAMPLDAYTVPYNGGTTQLTKGRWYSVENSTTAGMRVLNGDLVLYMSAMKNYGTCSLCRITPELTVVGSNYVLFSKTTLQTLDYCKIDEMYMTGSGKYIDTCAASVMADGNEIVLISYYDSAGYTYTYAGAMIRESTIVQELNSLPTINDTFYQIYGLTGSDFYYQIWASMDFSNPGGPGLIYKSGHGLWIAVNGYWIPFESALVATMSDSSAGTPPSSNCEIQLNGQTLDKIVGKYSFDLWGSNLGPMVTPEFYNSIDNEKLKIGVNVCAGIGLMCGWAASSTTRLWLMYVNPGTFSSYTIAQKKDGMI